MFTSELVGNKTGGHNQCTILELLGMKIYCVEELMRSIMAHCNKNVLDVSRNMEQFGQLARCLSWL